MRIQNKKNLSINFATLGKIKIGMKNEKGWPISVDYFVCYTDDAEYKRIFTETFGEKPKKLKICFVSDDINYSCSNLYELRDNAGKLAIYGDGETYFIANEKDYTEHNIADFLKKYATFEDFEQAQIKKYKSIKGFEQVLILRFMLPEMQGVLGVWELRTKASKSSIDSIVAHFDEILEKANRVKGIPFDLSVKKVKSNRSGAVTQYPVLQLVCNISFENVEKIKMLTTGASIGLLTDAKIEQNIEQRNTPQLKQGVILI